MNKHLIVCITEKTVSCRLKQMQNKEKTKPMSPGRSKWKNGIINQLEKCIHVLY